MNGSEVFPADQVVSGVRKTVGMTAAQMTTYFGGGSTSSAGNVTPDTHGTIPTGVGLGPNDEFEYGTSIDTTGARYSGATAWTWGNQSTSTAAVADGSMQLLPPVNDSNIHSLEQPLPGSGNWTYQTKITQVNFGNYNAVGMVLRQSSTGRMLRYCAVANSVSVSDYQVDEFTNYTTFNSTLVNGKLNLPVATLANSNSFPPVYVQLSTDGTNYYFSVSLSGFPGTFFQLNSLSVGGWLTADKIGLFALAANMNYSPIAQFDWFRRLV